jgi:hypothetical protein
VVHGKKVEGSKEPVLEPIFQAEANDAVRYVNATVEKTMRVGHKDLLPLLDTPNLFQKLFADDGLLLFKDLGDKEAALILALYLKPQLEQVRESFGEEKANIKVNEDGTVTVSDHGQKTKQLLARIQDATGTKYEKVEGKESYRPHSIKKFKFQNNADTVQIDEKTTVFLSVGAENGYLEDSVISASFTSKMAKDTGLRSSDLGAYSGVPLGAMVPFFGAKLPKGYVWADGQASFPNADWVPTHLRGVKVPDMREHLVGGAKDEANVGLVYNKGQLTVPEVTVSGGSFKLPANKTETLQIAAGAGKGGHGGFVFHFDGNDNYTDIKHGMMWNGFGGQYRGIQAMYSSFKNGEALQGEQKIPAVAFPLNSVQSNPRHVMCHWIIRVE